MTLGLGGVLLVVTGAIDAAILLAVLVAHRLRGRRDRRREWAHAFMRAALPASNVRSIAAALNRDRAAFLQEYMDLADSVELSSGQVERVRQACAEAGLYPKLVRDLRRHAKQRRIRAAMWLGYLAPLEFLPALVQALTEERRPSVRLHIVHALIRSGRAAVVPTVVDTLAGSDLDYQGRVFGMLLTLGEDFHGFFEVLRGRQEPEIRRLVAHLAARTANDAGRRYLAELAAGRDRELALVATRLLLHAYASPAVIDRLLGSADPEVVELAVEAIGSLRDASAIDRLLGYAGEAATRDAAVRGLSRSVREEPSRYRTLLSRAGDAAGSRQLEPILDVLALRVEYLIERVLRNADQESVRVLRQLAGSGRVSGIIAFLNRNGDPQVEDRLVGLIREPLSNCRPASDDFAAYARASVLERLGLARQEVSSDRGARVGEAISRPYVASIIIVTVVLPAVLFVTLRLASQSPGPSWSWVFEYSAAYARFFGFYAFTLNSIYLLLLGFAARAVVRQSAALDTKPLSMLFTDGMLPSISIVVPAYREEATIVENVNSLLNLRYPDFEVIVVNDGSPDNTLGVLIDRFELERVEPEVSGALGTQPIRGLYRNRRIPELLVIDKRNGGKADSLNAGINASRRQYFAAIDSDSLLERDSLIRLAGLFLESDVPVVATGGNILPVNGCTVDRGSLDEIRLPRNLLARLQTLEYVRSFLAGRTGWAEMRSLMIISGAFGLFRRQDVIDAHGYLTSSGYYRKDTVAEDMELVVRVSRMLQDRGARFAVQYSFSANCWTEVPTTRRIYLSQRDRWQRGLMDTMYVHRRMLFNPRYRQMGLIGFPYFFLFELLGPWVEAQGLVFLAAGLISGALSLPVAAAVFAATVPLGVAVSLSSLLLAEHHQRLFTWIDRLRLIGLAVMENFGYRQYAGLIRLRGYLSALARRTGWGVMVRTGFTTAGR